MYTLYIDTHFINLVLAIFKDKQILIKKELDCNSISENTIILLNEMLQEVNLTVHNIKEIIVISGPGSFTGVRIGIVIAKILAYCLNIEVKTISYLEAMALNYSYDVIIGVKDRNGAFIGEFDSNHNLLKDYYYLNNNELENKKNIIYDEFVDLIKVKEYADHKKSVSPHGIVPLYVKKLEVEL